MARKSIEKLSGLRLRDLKSFADSGQVPLRGLNVLVGANNAGKSTFMGAIELFFRSMRSPTVDGPLAFELVPSFASFDSSLRRHWNRSTQRPTTIRLNYEWTRQSGDKSLVRQYQFDCTSQGTDDSVVVARASYKQGNTEVTAERQVDPATGRAGYLMRAGGKSISAKHMFFHQLIPFEAVQFIGGSEEIFIDSGTRLEVVNPYRPVPRSFYVLDDPNLAAEDRGLLTYLIRLWASRDAEDKRIRERLDASLGKVGLTKLFEVLQVSKRIGPKVIEIRVAPTSSRQKVTIADAGFGLSQFLPLAVYDARLSNGTLVAYQPEVHLHPFAQSRLADVFVDSLARGNQLFVETHSVDLVLRLQAKIAAGSVDPKDVCVLCFENRSGASQVSEMTFDDRGAPSRPWPEGFFDTSLKLARELTSARVNKRKQAEG